MSQSSSTTVERLLNAAMRVIGPQHHATLTAHSLLFDEKMLDSFEIIQLVAEVEREFAIAIKTEDLIVQNFESIAEIAALVDRSLAAAE